MQSTANRLPSTESAPNTLSTVGRTVGTTLVQAAALVVAVKLVDALVNVALSRFRRSPGD
jgi:preprotein translocase subunit SecF